jgi:formylglycine-generating enzyme required for sulfatase activity
MLDELEAEPGTPTVRLGTQELPCQVRHRRSGLALVLVPPCSFTFGSPPDDGETDERPQRQLALRRPLWFGRGPVTVRQWRSFAASRPPVGPGCTGFLVDGAVEWRHDERATFEDPLPYLGPPPGDDHPVTQVSWHDAQDFCARHGMRLPTEPEFECVLRAGAATRYPWGDDPAGACGRGNWSDRSLRQRFDHWRVHGRLLDLPAFAHDDGYVFTSPVGTFPANAFGLSDVGGNVWEWCADAYVERAYEAADRDPHVPLFGEGRRVLRGASWDNGPRGARSARRYHENPTLRHANIGFRVVYDPEHDG